MASSTVRGLSNIYNKLEKSIETANYYEAHQMYRTLYFRLSGLKKYDILLEKLYDGALLFLNHDHQGSGADLAILLVDVLEKSNIRDVDRWIPKLTNLFKKIHPSVSERDTFLENAIQWSKVNDNLGHPLLHQNIAEVFWNEDNYELARHHYLRSMDGLNCARLLIEYHIKKGFRNEVDLFIAQAVLQYLCLSNLKTAWQAFECYTQQHPRIKTQEPPYLFPLLNFIWFLLQTVESKKLATFKIICEHYKPSLQRDPSYIDFLEKIGQIYFGIKPRRQNSGIFGNFLRNFLGEVDDSEEDSPHPSNHSIDTQDLD